jgi:hypothetical protein
MLLENQYATKDLYFAAFLYVNGLEVKSFEKYGGNISDHRPVYFIFENQEKCNQLEEVYWNGEGDSAMVNIRDFTNAVRNLRTRAFSVSRATKYGGYSLNNTKYDEDN